MRRLDLLGTSESEFAISGGNEGSDMTTLERCCAEYQMYYKNDDDRYALTYIAGNPTLKKLLALVGCDDSYKIKCVRYVDRLREGEIEHLLRGGSAESIFKGMCLRERGLQWSWCHEKYCRENSLIELAIMIELADKSFTTMSRKEQLEILEECKEYYLELLSPAPLEDEDVDILSQILGMDVSQYAEHAGNKDTLVALVRHDLFNLPKIDFKTSDARNIKFTDDFALYNPNAKYNVLYNLEGKVFKRKYCAITDLGVNLDKYDVSTVGMISLENEVFNDYDFQVCPTLPYMEVINGIKAGMGEWMDKVRCPLTFNNIFKLGDALCHEGTRRILRKAKIIDEYMIEALHYIHDSYYEINGIFRGRRFTTKQARDRVVWAMLGQDEKWLKVMEKDEKDYTDEVLEIVRKDDTQIDDISIRLRENVYKEAKENYYKNIDIPKYSLENVTTITSSYVLYKNDVEEEKVTFSEGYLICDNLGITRDGEEELEPSGDSRYELYMMKRIREMK